jgi:uncharacterized protein (DUF1778 family)
MQAPKNPEANLRPRPSQILGADRQIQPLVGVFSSSVPIMAPQIGDETMATIAAVADRERITARVPTHVRAQLERAADLSGATVNQFLVQAAVEKAERLIERERLTVLSERDARQLLELMKNPPAPSAKLQRAALRHQELLHAPDRTSRSKS